MSKYVIISQENCNGGIGYSGSNQELRNCKIKKTDRKISEKSALESVFPISDDGAVFAGGLGPVEGAVGPSDELVGAAVFGRVHGGQAQAYGQAVRRSNGLPGGSGRCGDGGVVGLPVYFLEVEAA